MHRPGIRAQRIAYPWLPLALVLGISGCDGSDRNDDRSQIPDPPVATELVWDEGGWDELNWQ